MCDWECTKSCELIEEMVITALKMGRDQTTTADLKLFNRSLKELRYAARVFAPYRHVQKVVVFGSARTKATEPEAVAAEVLPAACKATVTLPPAVNLMALLVRLVRT